MTTALSPAIHYGLSYEEYVALPGIRSSQIPGPRAALAKMRHAELHPSETAAMRLGIAVHAAILEPSVYAARYVACERSTGAGSRAANAARKAAIAAAGVLELDDEERAAVEGMRAAVIEHVEAASLIAGALACELTVTWTDDISGAPCKARLDVVRERAIVDLKTCGDGLAEEDAWRGHAMRYGYHRQAAWYLSGAAAVDPGGADRRWKWIVVESAAPYVVEVHEADDELLEIGLEECRAGLARRLEAERTGVWPGYPRRAKTIRPPAWMRSRPDVDAK